MTGARGFTLIELLIALSIFGVMAAMAYGGLAAVLETRESVDAALEDTRALQGTLFRIEADLEQAVARGIRDQFGDARPALLGTAETGLSFTRAGWRNPLQTRRSHLQRVGYRLNADNDLVRRHWRVLDRAQDSEPVETVLLEEVQTIEWRYLDSQGEWHDRWPPQAIAGSAIGSTDAGLPVAVELRLDSDAWGEIRYLLQIPGGNASIEEEL